MCTPGMILSALYYLNHPDDAEDVREALAGNQCRCTGYTRIFKSIEAVRDEMSFEVINPRSLDEALDALAADDTLVPLAGATDLMVYLEAGSLPPCYFFEPAGTA